MEQRELKKLNTQALKANRRTKRIKSDSNRSRKLKVRVQVLNQREQRKLNIKIAKENRRDAKRLAKEAKKKDATIMNSNKIENDEN